MWRFKDMITKKVLVVVLLLTMWIPSTAYADSSNVVEIGYDGVYKYQGNKYQYVMDDETGITTLGPYTGETAYFKTDVSVSNVVELFDVSHIDSGLNPGIKVKPNAKITLLSDGIFLFDVYKLTEVGENDYRYDYADDLMPVEGKVQIYYDTLTRDEYDSIIYKIKTLDASLANEHEVVGHLAGNTVTLSEPGLYYFSARYEAISGAADGFIEVLDGEAKSEKPVTKKPVVEGEEDLAAPKIIVNQATLPVSAVNKEGRVLVPLRAIFEALGAKVDYQTSTKVITGTQGDSKVVLTLNKKDASVNNVETLLDVPAQLVNGSTFVPVRFIGESLGAKVEWQNNTVIINSK